jgi:type IV secretion system protein VirD4
MLGVTEQEGAEFFSLRSGDSTVRVNSTMTVRRTIAIAQMIPQYRETDGLGRRRLLTPDEILRFPNDELLIIIRGENVLRAKKFDYIKHPYAKKLIPASIFEYNQNQHADLIESVNPRTELNNSDTSQTENLNNLFAISKPPAKF